MASRCPCALPGPCAGRLSEAQLEGAAQFIGRDGTRIMAATLTWLMQAEGAGTGGFFAMHPATDDRIQGVQAWPKGYDKGDIMIKAPETKIPHMFNLHGLRGISGRTVDKHMALYEEYVNATNELNEYIFDLVKGGRVDREGNAGLFPTDQTAGIWKKDPEHLSNCDQTTHDEIVSLDIDSHVAAVNDGRRES
jgi:hypothetical protein